jgi:hypothetical protein
MFRAIIAAGLMLATTSAQALAACNIGSVAGTWLINVEALWEDDYVPDNPLEIRATCWLVISRPRNLAVHCEDDRLFGLSWHPDYQPWHQIVRDDISTTQRVGARRFAVPNRCQWRMSDRNDLDIEYTVNFAPDLNTLQGHGEGRADKHFGATEPYSAFFTGIRQ